ncbi:UNVERIFIED_CONTAM: hypothetical protein FKN15_006604 [Acipenser sinensis]
MEATALTYNNHFIDIYTCCWGPKDNGKKMAGPGKLTAKALRMGSEKVTATNVDEGCVTHFTGTSSAAPMASGILALVLEANILVCNPFPNNERLCNPGSLKEKMTAKPYFWDMPACLVFAEHFISKLPIGPSME